MQSNPRVGKVVARAGTWYVGQGLHGQRRWHKAGLLQGRHSEAGAHQEGLQVVSQLDSAHRAAIHESQGCVGSLLAQLQGSRVVECEVDQLLADRKVRPWVAVQNLQRQAGEYQRWSWLGRWSVWVEVVDSPENPKIDKRQVISTCIYPLDMPAR